MDKFLPRSAVRLATELMPARRGHRGVCQGFPGAALVGLLKWLPWARCASFGFFIMPGFPSYRHAIEQLPAQSEIAPRGN